MDKYLSGTLVTHVNGFVESYVFKSIHETFHEKQYILCHCIDKSYYKHDRSKYHQNFSLDGLSSAIYFSTSALPTSNPSPASKLTDLDYADRHTPLRLTKASMCEYDHLVLPILDS